MKLNSESELLEAPIHQSLTRPILLAGADRRLTLANIGLSLVMVLMTGFSLMPILCAIVFGTFGQWGCVQLTKIDPYIFDIYPRHVALSRVYVAQGDIGVSRAAVMGSLK